MHSCPQQGSIWTSKPIAVPGLEGLRPINIYLPPEYEMRGQATYPLMYIFDGENLFDDYSQSVGYWRLNQLLDQRWREGLPVPVVVGIHHGPLRDQELSPWPLEPGHSARGQALLNWMTDELHPQVCEHFAVQGRPGEALLGGSFLGGLMAIYACFSHPQVFGRAFSLSPSLWAGHGAILEYIHQMLGQGQFNSLRLYLDTCLPAGSWGWPAKDVVDQALSLLDKQSDLDARALVGMFEAHGLEEGRHITLAHRTPEAGSHSFWHHSLNLALDHLLANRPLKVFSDHPQIEFENNKYLQRELSCW